MRPTAVFLAWWEVEGKEPVATYIVEGGELNHSMVTEATLKREGIAIPKTRGGIYNKDCKEHARKIGDMR